MKNIYILPTEKPSRLILDKDDNILHLQIVNVFMEHQYLVENQHIYITSNEEIKEGDRYVTNNGKIAKELYSIGRKGKIILTTDQDLINDGVQAIDTKFLEWFVKNPSCEFVEVKEKQHFEADKSKRINPLNGVYYSYKIILPQEEPKQETLEVAAERLKIEWKIDRPQDFIKGAKWQAEKSYSEEEIMNALHSVELKYNRDFTKIYEGMLEYLKELKNK
jgi:hypothetical protein